MALKATKTLQVVVDYDKQELQNMLFIIIENVTPEAYTDRGREGDDESEETVEDKLRALLEKWTPPSIFEYFQYEVVLTQLMKLLTFEELKENVFLYIDLLGVKLNSRAAMHLLDGEMTNSLPSLPTSLLQTKYAETLNTKLRSKTLKAVASVLAAWGRQGNDLKQREINKAIETLQKHGKVVTIKDAKADLATKTGMGRPKAKKAPPEKKKPKPHVRSRA